MAQNYEKTSSPPPQKKEPPANPKAGLLVVGLVPHDLRRHEAVGAALPGEAVPNAVGLRSVGSVGSVAWGVFGGVRVPGGAFFLGCIGFWGEENMSLQ